MKLLLAIMLLLPMLSCTEDKPDLERSTVSYEVLQGIENPMILDHSSLIYEEQYTELSKSITSHLIENSVIAIHPVFGILTNPKKKGFNINLVIESNGGYSSLALNFIVNLNSIKKAAGLTVTCYVNTAQSAAFTIMVSVCDKKVAIGNLTLMQHKAYYESIGYTSGTMMTDMKLAKIEADALGVDFKEWLKLTRSSYEDHVFTKKEIKKYKLIDKVL